MPSPQDEEALKKAQPALERLQKFDVNTLIRESELGTRLNFRDAIAPATRLVELYQRLSIAALEDFPAQKLNDIHNVATGDFNILNSILSFSPDAGNPQNVRQSLIQQLWDTYPNTFSVLHPLVAYSLHRSADFQRLDREARSALQTIKDESESVAKGLDETRRQAEEIVEGVRKVAMEAGVSQQALYFSQEASAHETDAETWRARTIRLAWVLGGYAVISLFLAKIPFLAPSDAYQSIQLGVSKVLIFAVISYMLYLSARNFLSHKHNAIVNRHRQNALLTYKALVDAASDPAIRQTVLTAASACIFGPQATGYAGDGANDHPRATSVVEVMSKPLTGS